MHALGSVHEKKCSVGTGRQGHSCIYGKVQWQCQGFCDTGHLTTEMFKVTSKISWISFGNSVRGTESLTPC